MCPIDGSKKIELDGRETHLPADDVALEEIVAAGVQLQQEKVDLEEKLAELKSRALEIARRHRFSKRSVVLAAPRAGRVRVTWPRETTLNEEGVRKLEAELPANIFDALFLRATIYSTRPGLRSFMKEPQVPETEELKRRVGQLLVVEEKNPQVKFFAADAEEDVGDVE